MAKLKKRIDVSPQFLKDKKGKVVKVYLPYDTFEAISERVDALKKEVVRLKKKRSKNKKS